MLFNFFFDSFNGFCGFFLNGFNSVCSVLFNFFCHFSSSFCGFGSSVLRGFNSFCGFFFHVFDNRCGFIRDRGGFFTSCRFYGRDVGARVLCFVDDLHSGDTCEQDYGGEYNGFNDVVH